jgi:hypothetical protein
MRRKGVGTIWEKITKEEFVESMEQNYGSIADMSRHLEISRPAIYDVLDKYPHFEEMRQKMKRRKLNDQYETAEQVLQKTLDLVDENPELAAKQAQFVLKNSKISDYNPDNNKNNSDLNFESAKELVSYVKND